MTASQQLQKETPPPSPPPAPPDDIPQQPESQSESQSEPHPPKSPPSPHPAMAPRAPTEPFTHARLLALTSGLVGIQFCWAVQVGYVTKSLLVLGLAQRYVSYAWLAGPIAGILVQPVVGLLSDRCTSRLGRRRPFLIAGSLLASVCLLTFAYAAQIGFALGDERPTERAHANQKWARLIAITSFWALDFAINAAQGPLRALLADVVPPAQHKVGNSYFALATGLGNCFGSLLGSFALSRVFTVFPGDLQALYTIAVVVLMVFMGITVVFIREEPLKSNRGYALLDPEGGDDDGVPSYASLDLERRENRGGVGFWGAALTAPYPFFQTFVVQCFTWFGWFCMFVFATSWVGAEVFNGSFEAAVGTKERELYDAGVRMGNLGISLQAVLTVLSSLLLPGVLRRVTVERVYALSHLVMGSALCCALFLHHKWQMWIAVALLASTGFSWAVTMTIPWSLMGEAVAKAAPELAGVYFTMFNLSQCVPEVIVSLVAEEVERITHSQAAVLGLGGLCVLVGGAIIISIGLGRNQLLQDDHPQSYQHH